MKVVIEVPKAERDAVDEIRTAEPGSVDVVEVRRFVGDAELIQAIVTITAATIPVVGSIVSRLLDKKKSVTVKVNGVEITGLTKENVREILEDLKTKKDT